MRAGEVTKKMINRKIVGIIVGSLILLIIFSVFVIAEITSDPDEEENESIIKNGKEDNQPENINQDEENQFENTENEENIDNSDDSKEGFGHINIKVFYDNGRYISYLPVQYAVVTIESEDGSIQRTGITNFRGHKTFRFLPLEHDYIVTISKKQSRSDEKLVVMSQDSRINYAIVYL
jgi:hypothetical protein